VEPDLAGPIARHFSDRQRALLEVLLAVALAASSASIVARGLYNTGGNDETLPPGPHGVAFGVASFVAVGIASLTLPARRCYPKVVLGSALVAEAVLLGLGVRVPADLAAGFAIYSLAAAAPRQLPYPLVVGAIAGLASASVVGWDAWTLETVLFASGAILVGWLAGDNARTRQSYALALAKRAAERERERARHAAMEERARIARELHDGVAHSMSVIAVRSGVARVISKSQPEQAIESLKIIEGVSRQSLSELRRMVAVLRQPDDTAAESLDPPHSLADLPLLMSQIAAAGVRVDLHIEGEERPLPLTEGLSAYRIAQESLTNIVRHSGAATADLCIRYRPGEVEIECRDPGGDRARRRRAERVDGGHGIAGMRERVALCGGHFSAGPAGQGFRVLARLPVTEEAG